MKSKMETKEDEETKTSGADGAPNPVKRAGKAGKPKPGLSNDPLIGEKLQLLECQQAAMEALVGNIAHQWRQPLNVLGLAVQKMQFDFEKNEVDDQYLEELSREVLVILKQMSRTVQNFRNFMQIDRRKELFNLNEAVAQVLSFVQDSMNSAGIEIRVHAGHEEIMVENFRNELSRVVLGVLNRSKKALQLSKTENPIIRLRLSRANRRCTLSISDNGGHIDALEPDKISEPGSSAATCGTGSELDIARMLIEQKMKGTLKVASKEEGMEVTIEL